MNIGIIGKGFVGSAVEHGFSCNENFRAKIKIYDINPKLSSHSLSETINTSDYIFLSVPTPANEDGSINLDYIDLALDNINQCIKNDCVILIRSTIVPGTSSKLSNKYPALNIVFNPEFLTEKNANNDFINQSRIILGGEKELTAKVANLYNWRFADKIPIIETDYETAELIKYMNNTFLATKVSFMNEMFLIADKVGADWDKAVEGFILDSRIGSSHVNVPGHDGEFGFGGSCFPKDIQAIIKFSKKIGVDSKVVEAAWNTNLKVRPKKDWEKLEGRAVVSKNTDD
jgi:UDPglucose 6-dehydrogenase|tara:strand:- start:62 stop:922 length:861 start_codon:yes stop_codon:yes gene_type:complete